MPSRPARASVPDPRRIALGFGAARVLIGAAALTAPVLSLRVLGADTATARRVTWLTRMAGARDGVLGAGALTSRTGGQRAGWVLGGAVADAADAAILFSAVRAGRLPGIVPRAAAVGAAGAAAMGAFAALRMRRDQP